MVDKELLSRKISQLHDFLSALKKAQDITWRLYEEDIRTRAFVERYIHLCIEKVIDVGNHLVSFERWREPEGYRDLFQVLPENEVILREQVTPFQDMASYRNMLVHRYEKIDNQLVFSIFKKHLDDFEIFISLVTQWAETH